jgi:putative tryptophan/tyrosine transport system substrate-binding protein
VQTVDMMMGYLNGLPGKQLELAREIIPSATQMGLLDAPNDVKAAPQRREIEELARNAGLFVIVSEVRTPNDIEPAYENFAKAQVNVAIVEETNIFLSLRQKIAEVAAARRLPSIYGYREHIQSGGLISYGVDLPWCYARAASYVDKKV